VSLPTTNAPILPLRQTLSARDADGAAALTAALGRCEAEDAAFTYAAGAEPGSFRIEARTLKELRARVTRATAMAACPLETGPVSIAPCWSPARLAEAEHRLGNSSSGGDFAVVRLRIVPRRSGEGNLFESEFAGPPEIDALNAAVERGVARASAAGLDGEGRIIDTRVVFIDGAFHATRSTPAGFEETAISAMRAACSAAGLRRLEPFMEIEIMAERDLVLPVVNDLAQHGGSELRRRLAPKGVTITAELPLSALLTYEEALAALSRGKAKLTGEPQITRWAEVRRR
jgi:translation elongation factor EF-G